MLIITIMETEMESYTTNESDAILHIRSSIVLKAAKILIFTNVRH